MYLASVIFCTGLVIPQTAQDFTPRLSSDVVIQCIKQQAGTTSTACPGALECGTEYPLVHSAVFDANGSLTLVVHPAHTETLVNFLLSGSLSTPAGQPIQVKQTDVISFS